MRPTKDQVELEITEVLEKSWAGGFSIQSDFARSKAVFVALCASEGWITTVLSVQHYGRFWHLTPEGSKKLYENRLYFHIKGPELDTPIAPSAGDTD